MVEVGEKDVTHREAVAAARVLVNRETFDLIRSGSVKKGDVLTVAQVAGIMGREAHAGADPMCHPVQISGVDLRLTLDETRCSVEITASVRCDGRTGVEMEALTAVSAAALTVYDMCQGCPARHGHHRRPPALQIRRRPRRFSKGGILMRYTAAVITVSDKCSRGERVDTSGPMLCTLLAQNECEVVQRALVPDEKEQIQAVIRHAADELHVQLILTTGGTGFSPRDITPEATAELIERAHAWSARS